MAKRPSREDIRATISGGMPEESQSVPKEPPTLAEQEAQKNKYNKPKSYRLPEELTDAVANAAQERGIPARDLVEFMLRAGLYMLANDKMQVTVAEVPTVTTKRIEDKSYQPIPDKFK